MQWERPKHLFARQALTDSGWQHDVLVAIDAQGAIENVETQGAKPPADALACDLLLPGMSNVHSHSFQRAMVGLTEIASGAGNDNFWSWRKVMYDFTHKLTPDHLEAISTALYIELLKHGYTAVGEFHYMHHDAAGKPYESATELSERIIAASDSTGIGLTHLPVMYESSNFGGMPANEGQRRFTHTADQYIALLDTLKKRYPHLALGIAPHSLRAVTPESLKTIISALPALGLGDCPIHMHISEQEKEVADCLAWSKQRPVEWLFNNAQVDKRWCLIHATHTTQDEIKQIAAAGAVAGLCPTTEANLGDGVFPTESYLHASGRFGIGTDSQVSVSPWEELRQLEYAQRLATKRRNVLCDDVIPSVGRHIFSKAASGGAQALGRKSGHIAKGYRADLLALSLDAPLLANKKGDQILDALVFGGMRPPITDVLVSGHHVIKEGRHILEETSAKALAKTMQEIAG